MALAIALDGIPSTNKTVVFQDVDSKRMAWKRIPVRWGRGIVVAQGISKPVATDHCVAVCCRAMAVYAMDYRD